MLMQKRLCNGFYYKMIQQIKKSFTIQFNIHVAWTYNDQDKFISSNTQTRYYLVNEIQDQHVMMKQINTKNNNRIQFMR